MRNRSLNLASAWNPVTSRRFRLFETKVNARFRVLGKRVTEIEVTLDPLVDHVAHTEREVQELDHRLTKLEQAWARRRPPSRRS